MLRCNIAQHDHSGTKSDAETAPFVSFSISANEDALGERRPDIQPCTVEAGLETIRAKSVSRISSLSRKASNFMTADFAQREYSRQANISHLGSKPSFLSVRQWVMSDPSTTIHQHLRAWRKYHRLTLEQLANKIGSKTNTISGWETGKRILNLKDLEKIAAAYGVHASLLLLEPPGTEAFDRLKRADLILKKMPPKQGEKWLEFGEASINEEDPK